MYIISHQSYKHNSPGHRGNGTFRVDFSRNRAPLAACRCGKRRAIHRAIVGPALSGLDPGPRGMEKTVVFFVIICNHL